MTKTNYNRFAYPSWLPYSPTNNDGDMTLFSPLLLPYLSEDDDDAAPRPHDPTNALNDTTTTTASMTNIPPDTSTSASFIQTYSTSNDLGISPPGPVSYTHLTLPTKA